MKKNQNKQVIFRVSLDKLAFTLVELIVVITILAILGTIAFISLQGYSAQARDSKRLSDIANIKKSLELFSLATGKFPIPDDEVEVSYSGEILRYQGTVGKIVSTNLSRNLNEKPVDPSTETEYIYSTTHSQTEYEVLGLYESELISTSSQPSLLRGEGVDQIFIQQSNAENQDYPKIDGNYNGIYIKTTNFYVPTPSIINSEITSNSDLDNTLIKSQIITAGNNIPLISTGGLNITLSTYYGTITEESTDVEKMELVEAIQIVYSGSQLASNTMYADILSRSGTGELVDFVDVVVLNRTEYVSTNNDNNTTIEYGSQGNPGLSCYDIYSNDNSSLDGAYWIDPDGEGGLDEFEVECLMETSYYGKKGWILVANRTASVTPSTQTTLITTSDSNKVLTDERWNVLSGDVDYVLAKSSTEYSVASVASMQSASCVQYPPSSLLNRVIAHQENSGCYHTGLDYCMFGLDNNYSYTSNLCSNSFWVVYTPSSGSYSMNLIYIHNTLQR